MGRPRKYATKEEANAARAEATRRKLQERRENDPEGYKEWLRNKSERQAQRIRDARAMVNAAAGVESLRSRPHTPSEGERGAERPPVEATAPEVEQAREYLDRVRAWRQGQFKRYYHSHPEFRARHLEKVAEYDRQKARQKRAADI